LRLSFAVWTQRTRYHQLVSGTVNAKTVRATLGVAKAFGLDVSALANARGVASALTDIDARFPHAVWIELWQDIISRTGSESLGIDAAERLPWGHYDVIDYLVGTSDALGTALRRIERYFAIISTGVTHKLEEHGDSVHLVRQYAPGCHTRLLAPSEFALACIVVRIRIALGVRWCPREVHFAAPAPSNDAPQRRFFDCPVRFEARTSAIVMDASALALPMPRPDAELSRILEQHAALLVGQLGMELDIVSRVSRIVANGLCDGDVSITHAARQVAMSVRSLQRSLASEGTSFEALVDRVRHEAALRILARPDVALGEISFMLGFSQQSAFTRAFKRWTGTTPHAYRASLRTHG
jgi:AraC-like DNA-binding protein